MRDFKNRGRLQEYFKKVILFIHGGGFVCLDSAQYLNFISRISSHNQVPVFCLDYKLSPEANIDCSLNEAYKFYLWIRFLLSTYLQLDNVEVQVMGDSGGGFLGLSLLNWCIYNKITTPKKISLIYPAINLDFTQFTKSALAASDHFLLNFSMLFLCVNSFLAQYIHLDIIRTSFFLNFLKTP